MNLGKPRRYPWMGAMEDFALAIAERSPTEQEFMEMWTRLGTVVRYLVTNDPRKDPTVEAVALHDAGGGPDESGLRGDIIVSGDS